MYNKESGNSNCVSPETHKRKDTIAQGHRRRTGRDGYAEKQLVLLVLRDLCEKVVSPPSPSLQWRHNE